MKLLTCTQLLSPFLNLPHFSLPINWTGVSSCHLSPGLAWGCSERPELCICTCTCTWNTPSQANFDSSLHPFSLQPPGCWVSSILHCLVTICYPPKHRTSVHGHVQAIRQVVSPVWQDTQFSVDCGGEMWGNRQCESSQLPPKSQAVWILSSWQWEALEDLCILWCLKLLKETNCTF